MTSLRWAARLERLRTSLFFVPMTFVVVSAAAGLAMVEVDRRFDGDASELPFVLTTTVDGARQILSTVAQATITFAGVAFSISLLIFQLASSEYSPRVVGTLFRDPFNRRVMGIVVGTFTYCLMVLRSVRGPFDDGGTAVVPNLSVALAVLLGVVAILAIVGFINHSAHTMEISAILHRVKAEAMVQLDQRPEPHPERGSHDDRLPAGDGHSVCFDAGGWVQQVDRSALLDLVPDGGTVRLDTDPGRYAVPGTPLCTLWPEPDDPDDVVARAHEAVALGVGRTMQDDDAYGVRQLADVALKALSTGVNDPTTAQDAIFHMTDVLARLLVLDRPPVVERDDRGRRLVSVHRPDHADLVALAYDELRRQAASLPTVCTYLLESLHLLCQALEATGLGERAAPLRIQAGLVVEGCAAAGNLPYDVRLVREAHARRFGPAEVL